MYFSSISHLLRPRHLTLLQTPLTSQLDSQLQRLERELEVVKQNEEALRRNYNAMQVVAWRVFSAGVRIGMCVFGFLFCCCAVLFNFSNHDSQSQFCTLNLLITTVARASFTLTHDMLGRVRGWSARQSTSTATACRTSTKAIPC